MGEEDESKMFKRLCEQAGRQHQQQAAKKARKAADKAKVKAKKGFSAKLVIRKAGEAADAEAGEEENDTAEKEKQDSAAPLGSLLGYGSEDDDESSEDEE